MIRLCRIGLKEKAVASAAEASSSSSTHACGNGTPRVNQPIRSHYLSYKYITSHGPLES